MSKKRLSTQAVPVHAWVEDHRPSLTRNLLEPQDDETYLFENMPSQEDLLCLPPTEAKTSSASMLRSDLEKKTLEYIQSFIRSTEEDLSKRLKLMDQVDILNDTMDTDTAYISAYAVSIIKFLIPWTASNHVQERERAMQKIIHFFKIILTCSNSKVEEDFTITGQLLGCFTLCYSDHSEVVSRGASEGFHLLYNFVTTHSKSEKRLILPFLMDWEQEGDLFTDPLQTTLFADPVEITMVFKKYLLPLELTDLFIAAVNGMREDNAHSTTVAISLLRAILRDHNLILGKVQKVVDSIHYNLDAISNPSARLEVFKALRLLGKNYINQVVEALLLCSPACDSTAIEMWRALLCYSSLASKVLRHLLVCMQSNPLKQDVSGKEMVLIQVAATSTLEKNLQQPSPTFIEELKNVWDKLCLVLIFWISQTFHLQEWELESLQSQLQMPESSPSNLARSAINTLRLLLRCVGYESEVLMMKKLTAWDLLLSAEKHHQGVSLFARGVVRNRPPNPKWMLDLAIVVLDDPKDFRHVTAMAFLVELLQCPDLSNVQDEDLLKCLNKHLASPKIPLCSLALESIFRLMEKQMNVTKFQPLMSEVLKNLQEFDRENTLKALRVVKLLANHLVGPKGGPFAVEVAPQVFPFFDDESHKVRSLAICLFGNLLEMVTTRQNKRKMRAHALRSLVPLLMHLHDLSPSVIQASWETLSVVGRFLSCHKLQPLINSQDKWSICLLITKLYRTETDCHFLSQSIKYLKSPHPSIRELAVRLVGLGAQETSSRRKLEIICTVLGDLKDDPVPSISDLTTQTIRQLENLHNQMPSRQHDLVMQRKKETVAETPAPGGSQQNSALDLCQRSSRLCKAISPGARRSRTRSMWHTSCRQCSPGGAHILYNNHGTFLQGSYREALCNLQEENWKP